MKVDVLPAYQYQMNRLTPKATSNDWKAERFNQMMEEMKVQDISKEEPIMDLLENIQQITEILEKEVTLSNLNEYKQALRSYLAHYVKHELERDTQELQDLRVYRKKVTTVRTVEEKLEGLTEKLLESHRGHFEMLQKIGEINGLIINLYA